MFVVFYYHFSVIEMIDKDHACGSRSTDCFLDKIDKIIKDEENCKWETLGVIQTDVYIIKFIMLMKKEIHSALNNINKIKMFWNQNKITYINNYYLRYY